MKNQKQRLVLEQVGRKLKPYVVLANETIPAEGWIYNLRQALNMSLRQLGEKMGISPQAVKGLEKSEKNGTISLKSMQDVARALDMQLVYALLPREGGLDGIVEKRARELANEIVSRTSQSMKLEDQENRAERIQQAIEEKTEELKNEMPKFLWD